jgi:hypothetical protein
MWISHPFLAKGKPDVNRAHEQQFTAMQVDAKVAGRSPTSVISIMLGFTSFSPAYMRIAWSH